MNELVEKNAEYVVDIIDNGYEGEGIAKIGDRVIFIPNCIKGERVKIKVLKVSNSVCYGKLIEIYKKSKYRVDYDCKTYEKCGGCNLRHVDYKKTLEMKELAVKTTLKKELKREVEIEDVIRYE